MQIRIRQLSLLLYAVLFAVCIHAQDRVDPNVEKVRFLGARPFSSLPFKKFVRKIEDTEPVTIEGIKVRRKTHQLNKPIFVSTELCYPFGEIESPFLDNDFFRVKHFVSYEYRKRMFAYEVEYEFFDGETGVEMGAGRSEFYVDEVGDGKFVIECVKDFKIQRLPSWVKTLQGKQ